MSETVRLVQYYCDLCNDTRNFDMNGDMHLEKIRESKNGLVLYSDIHICKDRITGVNNLRIDANFAIRSFEPQELPPVRPVPKFGIPGAASAIKSNDLKRLFVSHLEDKVNFKIIISDEWLLTEINFGVNGQEMDMPIQTITSDLGGLKLEFYESDIIYSADVEKWLHILVNALEVLPPTRFGFIIETLNYVFSRHKQPPSEFDIVLLKTILASHEVYFKTTNDQNRFDKIAIQLSCNISDADRKLLMELLAYVELNPSSPLLDYIKTHHYDLEYIIYLFLILEKEKLITIDRPGIINL